MLSLAGRGGGGGAVLRLKANFGFGAALAANSFSPFWTASSSCSTRRNPPHLVSHSIESVESENARLVLHPLTFLQFVRGEVPRSLVELEGQFLDVFSCRCRLFRVGVSIGSSCVGDSARQGRRSALVKMVELPLSREGKISPCSSRRHRSAKARGDSSIP